MGGWPWASGSKVERVPVVTVDSLRLARCNLIKIDVEGMEQSVIEGATETLAKFKPLLYVENDRKEKSAALVRLIDSLGYDMYWHLPPLFNAQNFLNNPQNVFDNIVSMNMICVHKEIPHQMQGFQQVEVPGPEPAAVKGP